LIDYLKSITMSKPSSSARTQCSGEGGHDRQHPTLQADVIIEPSSNVRHSPGNLDRIKSIQPG
jgi:hypothetical protein